MRVEEAKSVLECLMGPAGKLLTRFLSRTLFSRGRLSFNQANAATPPPVNRSDACESDGLPLLLWTDGVDALDRV